MSARGRGVARGVGHLAVAVLGLVGSLAAAGEGALERRDDGRAAAGGAVDGEWLQSRRDEGNGAFAELGAALGDAPRAWTFDGSGRVFAYEPGMTVWSSPALGLVEGRAVVAVGSYDRSVWLLDAATGTRRWSYTTGEAVSATPLIWRDGAREIVIAASDDRTVYALDGASGRRLWSTALEAYRSTLAAARAASPCLVRLGADGAGGELLVVPSWVADRSLGGNSQRAAVSALEPRTGRLRWQAELGDNVLTAAACGLVGDRSIAVVGSAGGNVFALDLEAGAVRWRHVEHDGVMSPPALLTLDGGARLVVTGSRYGAVRALDAASGVPRWSWKSGDRIHGSPVAARLGGRLVVVVASYDRHVAALDAATGEAVWRSAGARGGYFGSPAVVEAPRGLVVASAWDHSLHVLDAVSGSEEAALFTGRPLWEVTGLDASTWSSPALGRLGGRVMAFAGSYDGRLRALHVDGAPREVVALGRPGLFWLSFPATLVPLSLAALWLTRRFRLRMARTAARG